MALLFLINHCNILLLHNFKLITFVLSSNLFSIAVMLSRVVIAARTDVNFAT